MSQQSTLQEPQPWEYLVTEVVDTQLQTSLNSFGHDNWELMALSSVKLVVGNTGGLFPQTESGFRLILKRPVV